VGQSENELKHGKGRYRWANGGSYEGVYRAGKRHGQGMTQWHNDFMLHNNPLNILITLLIIPTDNPTCNPYLGLFKHPNGDSEVGGWKEGKKHGPLIYTKADGTRWSRVFEDDKLTRESRQLGVGKCLIM
jgi:hypothetical protein